ncbi:hypothetical protein A2U01_0068371, partial [Trifolium medium]|nr:hypothetical protein [Trifolium medium]
AAIRTAAEVDHVKMVRTKEWVWSGFYQ